MNNTRGSTTANISMYKSPTKNMQSEYTGLPGIFEDAENLLSFVLRLCC